MITPFRFTFLKKAFGDKPFTLLDIGSGNGSASLTKKFFPGCRFYGLDITRDYGYTEDDFKQMEEFYSMDLNKLDYAAIPDAHFDYIQMSHVIEHLPEGEKVLQHLFPKLKPGGYFYVEYPGKKSKKLPSMKGSLNFHDDPTHVRVYSVAELKPVFEQQHFTVLKSGTRRHWPYILLFPYNVIKSLVVNKGLRGYIFWDICGFAEFLFCQKS